MILQRYIFRELILTFLLGFFVLNLVCGAGLIFQMFRTYESVGLGFLAQALPIAFSYMAPWAILISATLTGTLVYGRMAGENEIDAIRASGIHAGRILAPAGLLAVFVLATAFLAQFELGPWGRYGQKTLGILAGQLGLQHPPPGHQDLKLSARANMGYSDAKEGNLENPYLYLKDDTGQLKWRYNGMRGRIEMKTSLEITITIFNGNFTEYDTTKKELVVKSEGSIGSSASFPVVLEDPLSRAKGPMDMAGLELVGEWFRASDPELKKVYFTEFHQRLSWALGPCCMIFLTVPIGIFVKKGTRLAGLGVAIPPLIAYLIVAFFAQSLVNRGHVSPLVGTYGPDFLVLVVASVLLWKVFRT